MLSKFDLSNLRGDLFGGITAGIVALPLALAMGVASGLGPIAGLYGAIMVGFFAALFGGTGSQVSGPTGPMTVVVAGLAANIAAQPGMSGNLGLIFTAIMIGGILQVAFGLFKLGDLIRLVPYPVISGFMSGIGAIIFILQLGPLLGHESPAGTVDALRNAPNAFGDVNIMALLLGLATFGIAMAWPRQFGRYLPGPLAALMVGTLISVMFGNVPVLGQVPTGIPLPRMPELNMQSIMIVLEAGFILAFLGSIDSLLTSLVADNMTRSRHDSNQELIGQGIGNFMAGLFGGTAGAGATMRTMVNIRSGGRTRLSGMAHALLLLAVVLGLSPLAAVIPHAVLAGILLKVGVDVIDWSYLKHAHRGPRWDLVLMLVVLVMTVFVDLLTAVAVGVVLAAIAFVKQVGKDQMERLSSMHRIIAAASPREQEILNQAGEKITVFDFNGPLSFGAAADLGHHARAHLDGGSEAIVMDFARVPFLDVSAALAVETVARDSEHAGRAIYMCGLNERNRQVLKALEADKHLPDAHYFATREEALEAAWTGLQAREADFGRLAPDLG